MPRTADTVNPTAKRHRKIQSVMLRRIFPCLWPSTSYKIMTAKTAVKKIRKRLPILLLLSYGFCPPGNSAHPGSAFRTEHSVLLQPRAAAGADFACRGIFLHIGRLLEILVFKTGRLIQIRWCLHHAGSGRGELRLPGVFIRWGRSRAAIGIGLPGLFFRQKAGPALIAESRVLRRGSTAVGADPSCRFR